MTQLESVRSTPTGSTGPLPADVRVAAVRSEAEAREVVRVLAAVWAAPDTDGKEPLPPELAWVLAHSGNYVAVAWRGDEAAGAAIGFRGSDEEGDLLHSHIVGVSTAHQGANIGYTLKQHQRRWALDRGLPRVTWTFDPLVGRNAYFNVVKLGARLTRYYVDFYGPMSDGINNGDETDRCLVTWRLDGAAARAAAAGQFAPADPAAYRAAGAAEVLVRTADGTPSLRPSGADVRLLQVPDDIVGLRRRDPAAARAWRLALREALASAFADGLEVLGVSRDCWYVLARPA